MGEHMVAFFGFAARSDNHRHGYQAVPSDEDVKVPASALDTLRTALTVRAKQHIDFSRLDFSGVDFTTLAQQLDAFALQEFDLDEASLLIIIQFTQSLRSVMGLPTETSAILQAAQQFYLGCKSGSQAGTDADSMATHLKTTLSTAEPKTLKDLPRVLSEERALLAGLNYVYSGGFANLSISVISQLDYMLTHLSVVLSEIIGISDPMSEDYPVR